MGESGYQNGNSHRLKFQLIFLRMNDSFRKSASSLLRYFPPALIVLMLGFFGYYSFHYQWILDDHQFQLTLKEKSIFDASIYFYENFNGRFASHFFLCSVISSFASHDKLLFIYRFIMLFAFIISLSHLLKHYLESIRNKFLSPSKLFFLSAFITSFLFFFFFSGRIEVWIWISSTGVYLISLMIGMNAFALLLSKKQTPVKIFLTTFLFFLAGGFSESYVVMFLILLFYLGFKIIRNKLNLTNHKVALVLAIIGIAGGLAISLISLGVHNRLGMLHDFGFLYAFKNTAHSLAFTFLRYKYFLIEILLIACFLLYAHFRFPIASKGMKYFFRKSIPVLLFISISFFLPCYILSDIVPDRAASLGYFAGVLFLFDYFIFTAADFADSRRLYSEF